MPTLSSAYDLMMGLGKPQLRAKFEVANPSRCRYIIGETKIWGALLAQGHPTFSSGCDFMMGLANSSCVLKLKSLASAVAEIIKWKPKFRGAPLAQRHTHFFFYLDLMMGLCKPQLHAKFEVAGSIYCGNIRKSVFKRQIRFF